MSYERVEPVLWELVIAHSAQRWALRHLLEGVALEELVDAPFDWQEGWEYVLASRLE